MSNTHRESLKRALVSLEGLTTGDAFGEQFFANENYVLAAIEGRSVPQPPPGRHWNYTDDTEMALSLVGSLANFGRIEQDWLAHSFAEHFDLNRGYGVGMCRLLDQLRRGNAWQQEAKRLFYNEGSYGNGAAMRVAPLGAYFADDFRLVIEQATRSAEVTHAHSEGIAGAIGVAVAAATACRWANNVKKVDGQAFLAEIIPYVPASEVKTGLETALTIPANTSIWEVVKALGNGSNVTAQDTVPFTLWSAAHHLDDYEEALWFTVNGLGDRDTTCAIVGGIVASYTGKAAIPDSWLTYRETLPDWAFSSGL